MSYAGYIQALLDVPNSRIVWCADTKEHEVKPKKRYKTTFRRGKRKLSDDQATFWFQYRQNQLNDSSFHLNQWDYLCECRYAEVLAQMATLSTGNANEPMGSPDVRSHEPVLRLLLLVFLLSTSPMIHSHLLNISVIQIFLKLHKITLKCSRFLC